MKNIFVFLISTACLLIINYLLGTQSIIDSHKTQFNGGICGACETCVYRMKELACDKYAGFDFWILSFSLIIFSFILGLSSILSGKNLKQSFLAAILGTISFIILIEIIVRFFKIPVLYTSPLEGKQALAYVYNRDILLLGFFLFFSAVSGLLGIFIAKTSLQSKNKNEFNHYWWKLLLKTSGSGK